VNLKYFTIQLLQQPNLCPEEHLSFSDEKGDRNRARRPWDLMPSGHRIGKPAPLFKGLVYPLFNFACSSICLVNLFNFAGSFCLTNFISLMQCKFYAGKRRTEELQEKIAGRQNERK
jgi:hypothetical protein